MKKLIGIFTFILLSFAAHAQLTVAMSQTSVSCYGGNDGSATATPNGGTAPYTYAWAPSGAVTATSTGLSAGTYTCIVTDAAAATVTGTILVTEPMPITLNVTPMGPPTICAGSNVAYSVLPMGGSAPYAFNWTFQGGSPASSTSSSQVVNYASPGMFNTFLTVTDANGCVVSATITLTVGANPTITVTEIPSTCNQSNASMSASGAMTYMWVPGNLTGATVSNLMPGTTYTCTGTDANGCSTQVATLCTDSCDYVWPGDANDDAVADNIDILDIGIANGATGTTRPGATTTWIGQPSTAWGQTLLSGTDYKWVDCDGNGTINPVDTMAVVLNYGMTHTNRLMAPSTNALAPTLSISFDQDSLTAGQAGTITLSIGDTVDGVTNGYGLAFRLNYDAAQLSTPTFGLTGGATWFGTPGVDLMRVVLHPNPANGYVDVAITRYNQTNVNGYGTIGQIYFTTTTNLYGTGNTVDVAATITNVTLTDNTGTTQVVNVANDNVVVADTGIILAVAPIAHSAIPVYPNPANETLQLQIPAGASQVVTIEDVSGRVVYSRTHAAGLNTISVADLPGGMYVLRTSDVNGNTSTQKITIAH